MVNFVMVLGIVYSFIIPLGVAFFVLDKIIVKK